MYIGNVIRNDTLIPTTMSNLIQSIVSFLESLRESKENEYSLNY